MLPHVVIIGGGYAGAMIAQQLQESCRVGKLRLTVVDKKDYMYHKIASIRATVTGDAWTDRVLIPLKEIVRYGDVLRGEVKTIDKENQMIIFKEEEIQPLEYDLLVLATGAVNLSPGDLPEHIHTKQEVRDYLNEVSSSIASAKDIVLVGGGASAVEYAGEIRAAFPSKKLTLIYSNEKLLSSSIAPLSKKFMAALQKKMHELDIHLISGEKVVKPTDKELGQGTKKLFPNVDIETCGEKNIKMHTDLMIWAATTDVATQICPLDWVNEMNEVAIDSTFRVRDESTVFAFGDCCSLEETKQCITLPKKIKYVVNNVLKTSEAMRLGKDLSSAEKQLSSYKVADKATMYLPFGPKMGLSQINGWTYGDAKTSKWKGRDLYTDFWFKKLTGNGAPQLKI